jgi:beta-barrel assembly-enhancing protease
MREILNKVLLAVMAIGLISCASTKVSSFGSSGDTGLLEDERRIWNRSIEEQEKLDRSGYLYDDSVLTGYLDDVLKTVVPENVKNKPLTFKTRVVKNPLLNAFAYPNGIIYIHTGIIAKMENEAQLATLLGHELTHATNRHAVQNWRSIKNKVAFAATISTLAIPFGVYGSIASLLGEVGAMASISGYSKSMESEADQQGFDLIIKAGYSPLEAPKLFEHLKRDIEEQKIKEPFFFGTHPKLQDRIDNFNKYLQKIPNAGGVTNKEQFESKIQKLLIDNTEMDLALGRYSSAMITAERIISSDSTNAKGHFYLGQVYRQRANEGEAVKAEQEYSTAARYDTSYAEPHRELGVIYLKKGSNELAREEFNKYLTLAPTAGDKKYIEQYLEKLK